METNTTTYFTSANVVRVITETDVERKIKELEEKYGKDIQN